MRYIATLLLLISSLLSAQTSIPVQTTGTLSSDGTQIFIASTLPAPQIYPAFAYDLHANLPATAYKLPIYAHVMCWFGGTTSTHANVGYDSASPITIHKQYLLMAAVGINGVIIDWYGKESVHTDTCTAGWFAEATQHAGFKVGIVIDKGAVKTYSSPDKTVGVIEEMKYIEASYSHNPSFMTDVFEFGLESNVNWTTVRTTFPTFKFMIQGPDFAWGASKGATYLAQTYAVNAVTLRYAAVGAYFNDSCPTNRNYQVWDCVSTKPVRLLDTYRTGANWLAEWKLVLPAGVKAVQLTTWNDYEEGTALEGFFSMATNMSVR